MEQIVGWVAPAATMIAAMMTAANLGARVTGWGFVVFTVGSIAWSVVAIRTGQQNLLWTNAFLTLVNAAGIWRWLGRQARYDDGGKAASKQSAAAPAPTLFPISGIPGAQLVGRGGEPIGTLVDGMMRCDGAGLAYVVVSEGGLGGVGERLHALEAGEIRLSEDGVSCMLDAEELRLRPVLEDGQWPQATGVKPRPGRDVLEGRTA